MALTLCTTAERRVYAVFIKRRCRQRRSAVSRTRDLATVSGKVPIGDGVELIACRADICKAERTMAAATARIGIPTVHLNPLISVVVYTSLSR